MSYERDDQEDWEWRELAREQRRAHSCQCGGDMPGQCPGPAHCPMVRHEQAAPRVEYDFTNFKADDSDSMTHEIEPIVDPYEEFELAMMRLVSGPLYVPTDEVMP